MKTTVHQQRPEKDSGDYGVQKDIRVDVTAKRTQWFSNEAEKAPVNNDSTLAEVTGATVNSEIVIKHDYDHTKSSNNNSDEIPDEKMSQEAISCSGCSTTQPQTTPYESGREIKQEVIPSNGYGYSLDDWCELGSSSHEFGHNPDQNIDLIDFKDEIKKSPYGDIEKTESDFPDFADDNNNNTTYSKTHRIEEGNITPPVSSNANPHPFLSGEDCVPNISQYFEPRTIPAHEVLSEKHRANSIKVKDATKLLDDTTTDKKLFGFDLKELKSSEVTKTDEGGNSPVKIKNENIDSPKTTIQTRQNQTPSTATDSIKQKLCINLSLEHEFTKREYSSTFDGASFAKEFICTLPQQPEKLNPKSDNSSSPNTESTSLTQLSPTNNHTPVRSDSQSVTPPANSLQSFSEIPMPLFAQNFLKKDPLNNLSNYSHVFPPALVPTNIHNQYFNTSSKSTRLHQTWVNPNPFGYFQCRPTPSLVDNGSNSKLMLLGPQTIFLHSVPYPSIFQQPSFSPYATSFDPLNTSQSVPVNTGSRTTVIPSNDQTEYPVFESTEEVSGVENTSYLKPTDMTRLRSKVLDVNSSNDEKLNGSTREAGCQHIAVDCNYIEGINVNKHEDVSNMTHDDLKQKNLEIQNIEVGIDNSSESVKDRTQIFAESSTRVEQNGRYSTESSQDMIIPKMSRGDDFVDPTRTKLAQDDEMGDNGASGNEEDSSDEEWLPETRDSDKMADSDNEEDIDIDEEDAEDREEGRGSIRLGTTSKRQKKQRTKEKNKKTHESSITNTMPCHYCGKVFHGNYHLKRHLLSHTENRPHQCNMCGKRFKQKAHLHGHEIVHLREKSKPPKNKSTASNANAMHRNSSSPNKCPGRPKKVYSEKELSCNVCSKVFKTLYRLKRHVQSHTDLRPYTCKVCGKGFKQTGHRNEHEANHEKNRRKFLCNICGVIFHCRSSFNNHLKTHRSKQGLAEKGEATSASTNDIAGSDAEGRGVGGSEVQHTGYDCPYCPDKFATAQGLNRHLESHVEVRQRLHVQPYSCQICSRAFTYKHNLAKHMLTHQAPEKFAEFHKSKLKEHLASGRPSYTCLVCSKVFMRKETLAKHSKVHSGTKPFKCEVCHKEFTQNVHLKVHMRKHTGSRPFQCKRCNVGFIDSTALAKHIEYEACISENMLFHCTICDKRHYYLGSIKQHIKKEHNKHDVDTFISRTMRHKRPRPANASTENACKICSKSFSEKVNLIRHVKRKHGDLLKLLDSDLNQGETDNASSEQSKETSNRRIFNGPMPHTLPNLSSGPTDRTILNKEGESNDRVIVHAASSPTHCPNQEIEASSTSNASNASPINVEVNDMTNPLTYVSRLDSAVDKDNAIVNLAIPDPGPFTPVNKPYVGAQCPQWKGNEDSNEPREQYTTAEVIVGVSSPRETDKRGTCQSALRTDEMTDDCDHNERITETNVKNFLYHVGLVEKSKASGRLDLGSSQYDTPCCKSNANSCAMPLWDSESLQLQKPSDNCSINCSGSPFVNKEDVQVGETFGEIQNPTDISGDFRSNLEVFCDLALMTENRFVKSSPTKARNDSSTSTNSVFTSSSAYLNEFQTAVSKHRNESVGMHSQSQSSVTEAQLKELGLLVCKDAQSVRNRVRPLEDLYTEFKPWLEQLVKPPVLQSPVLYTAKSNMPTAEALPKMIYCNRNELSVSDISGGSPISNKYPDASKNPLSFSKPSYRFLSSAKSANEPKDAFALNQKATAPSQISWTSRASPLNGIPNVQISSNNYIHSLRLKEQLLQCVTDNLSLRMSNTDTDNNTKNTKSSFPHRQKLVDSTSLSETHSGKEASAQTQTPLHFDSTRTTSEMRASYAVSKNILNPKPHSSSTESNTGLLQDSKILQSLLGGIQQQQQQQQHQQQQQQQINAPSPRLDACNNVLTLDGGDARALINSSPSLFSNSSNYNMDEDPPVAPLQIVTTQARASSAGSSLTHAAAKVKGPFPCHRCGKCFNARHQLKRHEMTHTEIRPYRCPECGKAFRQKVHLSDHLKRHRGQRPFLCTICGKRFVLKNELKQHTKNYCRKTPNIVS